MKIKHAINKFAVNKYAINKCCFVGLAIIDADYYFFFGVGDRVSECEVISDNIF